MTLPYGELAARYGTPLYVYDADSMRQTYLRLARAMAGFAEVYYSIKANPNPEVARVFVELGAGLEVASGGEFDAARAAGCAPSRILFAGPGKGADELEHTIRAGAGEIHLESFEEIEHVARIGRAAGRRVPVAIRINPSAAALGGAMRMGGKPAPFGFDEEILETVLSAVDSHDALDLAGIHLFAGTQILDAAVLLNQWRHAMEIAGRLGRPLRTIDLGGGLGIPYFAGEAALDLEALQRGLSSLGRHGARVIIEPGRYLTAEAGVYLMAVRAVKRSRGTRFIVTDGGMHHHLAASGNLGQVIKRDYPIVSTRLDAGPCSPAVVAGPLCTPLDTLGRQTMLPEVREGDLLAVLKSGAYGLTASPTGFLSHPTPAEVLVSGGRDRLIRARGATSAGADERYGTRWDSLSGTGIR